MSGKELVTLKKKTSTPAVPVVTPRMLRGAILDAADQRHPTGTICPSEVARLLWPEDWRSHMEDVRQSAAELCAAELLQATQRSMPVQIADSAGPIRLKARKSDSPRMPFRGRLGLCCMFSQEPIQFRTTTATSLARLPRSDQLEKLSAICLSNSQSLRSALTYCAAHHIGAFRIVSSMLPVSTHPKLGYHLDELPGASAIRAVLLECRQFAEQHQIRTSFHPDQFVVLNSPRKEVVEQSLADLAVHTELAELVGADAINIHGGGAYGDKTAALAALVRQIEQLPDSIRDRLTLENDDRVFTPTDLLPVCRATGVPLVYDVHHHRCLPDGLSVSSTTEAALSTWAREPLFHLSSPLEGWTGKQPERHHDEIAPGDFPPSWLPLEITVDVEAKAKEIAVLKLLAYLKPS